MSTAIEMNSDRRLLFNNQKKLKQHKPVDSILADLKELDEEQDFHTPMKVERVHIAGNKPFTTPEERKQITNLFVDLPVTFQAQNNVLLKYGYSSLALKKIKELRASIGTTRVGSSTSDINRSSFYGVGTAENIQTNLFSPNRTPDSTFPSSMGVSSSSSSSSSSALSFSVSIPATPREIEKDIIDTEAVEEEGDDDKEEEEEEEEEETVEERKRANVIYGKQNENHASVDMDMDETCDRYDDADFDENVDINLSFEDATTQEDDHESEEELEEEDEEEDGVTFENEAFEIMKKNQEDNAIEDIDEEDDEIFQIEAMTIMKKKREEEVNGELEDEEEPNVVNEDEEKNQDMNEEDEILERQERREEVPEIPEIEINGNNRTRGGKSPVLTDQRSKAQPTRSRSSTKTRNDHEGLLINDPSTTPGRLASNKAAEKVKLMFTTRACRQAVSTSFIPSKQPKHFTRTGTTIADSRTNTQKIPNIGTRTSIRRNHIDVQESLVSAEFDETSISSPVPSINRVNNKRRKVEVTSSQSSASVNACSSKRPKRPTTPLLSLQKIDEVRENSPYRSLFNTLSRDAMSAPQSEDFETTYPSTPLEEPELCRISSRSTKRTLEPTMSQSEDRVVTREALTSSIAAITSSSSSSSSSARLSTSTKGKKMKNIDRGTNGTSFKITRKKRDKADVNLFPRATRNRRKVEILNIEAMSSAKEQYRSIPSSTENSPCTAEVSSTVVVPSPNYNAKTPASQVKRKAESPLSDRVTRSRKNLHVNIASMVEAPSVVHSSSPNLVSNRCNNRSASPSSSSSSSSVTIAKKSQTSTLRVLSSQSPHQSTTTDQSTSSSCSISAAKPSSPKVLSLLPNTTSQSQNFRQNMRQGQQFHQNNGNDNLRERSQPQQRSTSHWLSLKPITSWISTIFSSPLSKSQSPQEKSTLEASDEISGKRLDNEYSQIQSTLTLSPNNSSSLSSSLSPVPSSAVRSIQHQRRPKKTSRRSTQKTRHTKDVRIIAYGGNDDNMSSNRGNDANVGLPRPAVGFFEMIRNWFGF